MFHNLFMDIDYQKIRNKIAEGKEIVEKYKDETPRPVLEVCFSMFEINEMLVDKLEEIDNKISKNSRNSSIPPSKDPNPPPKKNKSLRDKSGKKKDEILQRLHSSRQVFDVEIINTVTEHQIFEGQCACGKAHCASYPAGVNANVQYGSSVRAIVGYLTKYQLIPSERLEEMMNDIFNTTVSEGTIDNISNYAENSLNIFGEKFKKHVPSMKVGNVDETPTKINGMPGYFHVLADAAFSFLYYDPKRGMSAVDRQGLLAKFKGVLVHDCFSMYFNYGKKHAVCNAHLLRELTFVEEKYNHRWAHKVKRYLFDLNELVNYYKGNGTFFIDKNDQDSLKQNFEEILLEGRIECADLITAVKNDGKKRGKQHPSLNLLNRMLKLQKEILKFMTDFDIPFTNNQAERDLLMTKVHLKISGGFRSEHGAQIFALFRSYISTAKKHGQSVFTALKNLYNPSHNETLDLFFKPPRLVGS